MLEAVWGIWYQSGVSVQWVPVDGVCVPVLESRPPALVSGTWGIRANQVSFMGEGMG